MSKVISGQIAIAAVGKKARSNGATAAQKHLPKAMAYICAHCPWRFPFLPSNALPAEFKGHHRDHPATTPPIAN